MNADLELALKAVDEIDDISKWKEAFVTEIAERTLQNELSKDAENSSRIVTMNEDLLIKNFPEIFQMVCLKKLTEYKQTIHDQREEIQTKQNEVLNLKEENFQFREMANTFAANIENLKEFLDKADASNSLLRTENQNLLNKLNSLENHIAEIEVQHANHIRDLIREESEKYQVIITQLEFQVNQQKDVLEKLELDVQEYNLLKRENEILQKENSKIDFLKRENSKLEEALTDLNKDYQETIVLLAKEQCMSPYNLDSNQTKEFGLSNRSKNSTTTSRNVEESDDDTQNKNNMVSKESSNLTPRKSPSRHIKGQSLMEEVIITKFSTTPTSGGTQNAHLMNKYKRQQKKGSSNSQSFKSIDLNKQFGKKILHSNSMEYLQIALPDQLQTEKVDSHPALAFTNEVESTSKPREIVASDLGSETEAKHENFSSKAGGEAEQDLLRMFGDEKVMQSWDEEDFKRLPSMVSMVSSKKGSVHGLGLHYIKSHDSVKDSAFKRRKGRAMSGHNNNKRKFATAVKEKRAKGNGVSSHSHSVSHFPPEINTDSTPPEHNKSKSVHIGLLLRQKLEQLKSREELRSCLHKQDLGILSMQSFENLPLERTTSLKHHFGGDDDSVIAVEELEANMEEGSPVKRNLHSDLLSGNKDDKVEIHTTPLFQYYSDSPAMEDVTESEQKQLPILSYLLEKKAEKLAEKEVQTEDIQGVDIEIQADVEILGADTETQTEDLIQINDQEIQTEDLIQINHQEIQTEDFITANAIDKEVQAIQNSLDQEIQTDEIVYEKQNKTTDDTTACDTTLPETNASHFRLSELNFSMIPVEKKVPRFDEMKTVLETADELKETKPETGKRSLLTSLVLSVIPFAIGSSLTYLLLKKKLR